MEQAAILKSGIVVKLTGLTNPKYTIYGFLSTFETKIDKETKKFRQTLFTDFRKEDQRKESISGFYEEESFLEYLADKENKFHLLKKYDFKLATAKDEIIVRKLKVVDPYIDFCKIETYNWIYQPNVPIFDYYKTLQIIIPSEVLSRPLIVENVRLTNTAMQFYADKIKRFVSPQDTNNRQEKAFLIAKIALRINLIEQDLYSQFLLETNTDFGIYLTNQSFEWTNSPIFINPTVAILEDYLRNLDSFYKSFYANQKLIKSASKKDKFYWLARVLSPEALATVPVIDRFELLYKLSKQNVKLTEHNGGESIALKVIESFTFLSVSTSDRNDLLENLVNFHNYITFQGGKGPHAVESKTTLFEILYKDIDDDRYSRYTFGLWTSYNNRMKFIILLYRIWFTSKYNPEYLDPSYVQQLNACGVYEESPYMELKNNPDQNNSIKIPKYFNHTTPPFLIYETVTSHENGAKIETSTNFSYKMVGKSIEVYQNKIESRKGFDNHYSDQVLYGTYDFLQPITIIGLKPDLDLVETLGDMEKGTSIGDQNIHTIPAFLLFYMEDYSNLKKIDFGLMLSAEIALNLTGVGALSELRYLGYLSKLRPMWTAESVALSDVVLSWKAVGGVVNALEFTAINAIALNNYVINTTNDSTTKEIAKKANTYLMWVTIFSMTGRPYVESKVIESAFELNSVVKQFNNDGISIYRTEMTPFQIQELDQALIVVKNIAGDRELAINTVIQKLTAYGTDSSKILQKYKQITSSAEKYAFYVDLGFFEDSVIRKLFNNNDAKAIDNWRFCYANGIISERKYIRFLAKDNYSKDLAYFYTDANLRKALEPLEINKKLDFLDTFTNINEADFTKFTSKPELITKWMENYNDLVLRPNFLTLSASKQLKWLEQYGNFPTDLYNQYLKTNPDIILSWNKYSNETYLFNELNKYTKEEQILFFDSFRHNDLVNFNNFKLDPSLLVIQRNYLTSYIKIKGAGYPFSTTLSEVTSAYKIQGQKLYIKLNEEFLIMKNSGLTEKQLKDIVLKSGFSHEDYPDMIILRDNISKKQMEIFMRNPKDKFGNPLNEIWERDPNLPNSMLFIDKIKAVYKEFEPIYFEIHLWLEKRLNYHLEQRITNKWKIDADSLGYTGHIPGTHAEIRALNELLWRLEANGMVINDDIVKKILGYNKNYYWETLMPRCGDCLFISKEMRMIMSN